jgi:hypothetical protein
MSLAIAGDEDNPLRLLAGPGLLHCAMHFRHDIERAFPFGVVEDVRRHHQLVGPGSVDKLSQATPHGLGFADNGTA